MARVKLNLGSDPKQLLLIGFICLPGTLRAADRNVPNSRQAVSDAIEIGATGWKTVSPRGFRSKRTSPGWLKWDRQIQVKSARGPVVVKEEISVFHDAGTTMGPGERWTADDAKIAACRRSKGKPSVSEGSQLTKRVFRFSCVGGSDSPYWEAYSMIYRLNPDFGARFLSIEYRARVPGGWRGAISLPPTARQLPGLISIKLMQNSLSPVDPKSLDDKPKKVPLLR